MSQLSHLISLQSSHFISNSMKLLFFTVISAIHVIISNVHFHSVSNQTSKQHTKQLTNLYFLKVAFGCGFHNYKILWFSSYLTSSPSHCLLFPLCIGSYCQYWHVWRLCPEIPFHLFIMFRNRKKNSKVR